MSAAKRLFPAPVLSVILLGVWLLLTDSVGLGQWLLGGVLAIGIPLLTQGFWLERVRIRRPFKLLHLLGRVMWDIVVANFTVARLILGPRRNLHPGFVIMPIRLRDPLAITLLLNIISLTPGTVSADVDREAGIIHVHGLDVADAEGVAEHIRRHYEQPLWEIFEC